MPQEAINTGYVKKIDTPESLAIHLKALIKKASR
jgi:chemotaxis response regulator CheB